MKKHSRRTFLTGAGTLLLGLQSGLLGNCMSSESPGRGVDAHLWAYAKRYPPNWDCTPILDEVFSDISYAGYQGVEIMESILRRADAVQRLLALTEKYSLPVAGTSYNASMWKKDDSSMIAEEAELVIGRLAACGGKMIGITVGDAGRKKTEVELDTQADVLKTIIKICKRHNVVANLHNHTFEMAHDMFDFKGTTARVPDLGLGPDLNWLVRAGVDPVAFIKTYGKKMVYMHLRDQDAAGKWSEAVGDGTTDFKSIASALKEVNYSGRAAVELAYETSPVNPLRENLRKSRLFVKDTFGW